ncbi:hypothetical protein BDR07DRAFT_1420634 [Suillus spraguei]|nr:hypothetical protein BDR07DRAFT_1420634 [Suillus spraguei]
MPVFHITYTIFVCPHVLKAYTVKFLCQLSRVLELRACLSIFVSSIHLTVGVLHNPCRFIFSVLAISFSSDLMFNTSLLPRHPLEKGGKVWWNFFVLPQLICARIRFNWESSLPRTDAGALVSTPGIVSDSGR